MKKRFGVFLLMVLGVLLMAQGIHQDKLVLNPEGTSNFYVTGTGKDTSAVIELWEIMSCGLWAADTAGNDSVAARLIFQVSADTALMPGLTWETHDTLIASFAADSAIQYQEITHVMMPNAHWGRYIIEGTTGNAEVSAVRFRIIHMNYESYRRR